MRVLFINSVCGTPVIKYDAGGCPETLKDERSHVVKCGDIERVEALIESMQ